MGTIFGGVLLSYIDQAGAVGAICEIQRAGWPRQGLVTVAMNAVEFHQPVFVGDVVSFWTQVTQVGTTSITIHVSVEAEREGQTRPPDRGGRGVRGDRRRPLTRPAAAAHPRYR